MLYISVYIYIYIYVILYVHGYMYIYIQNIQNCIYLGLAVVSIWALPSLSIYYHGARIRLDFLLDVTLYGAGEISLVNNEFPGLTLVGKAPCHQLGLLLE